MQIRRSSNIFWRLFEVYSMTLGLSLFALVCLHGIPLFLLIYVLFPRRLHRPVSRRLIRFGCNLYLFLLHWLCDIHADRKELAPLDRQEALIVIANHPSLIDAVILLSCLPNACCIFKASLINNPLLGFAARMAGYVSNAEPRSMIEGAGRELQGQAHFILFPEGGRSRSLPLSPMSSACILLSKQAQVPIQTVILEFSSPYLGKDWGLFNPPLLPLHFKARLGQRFDPPQLTGPALTEIEQYFQQALEPCMEEVRPRIGLEE
jgi:1-acyl-sn-glycerol-3-phosphate acyltransferase